jgi:hypothetical protein
VEGRCCVRWNGSRDRFQRSKPYGDAIRDRSAVRQCLGRPVELVGALTSCSYGFQEGKKYLVYAWKSEDGSLSTSVCSRTRALEQADKDVRYLISTPAAGSGGRVYGRINESRQDPAERDAVDYGPVERVPVSAHQPFSYPGPPWLAMQHLSS